MNFESVAKPRSWLLANQLDRWQIGLLVAGLLFAFLKPVLPLPFWIMIIVFPAAYLVRELWDCDAILRRRLIYIGIAVALAHLAALFFRGKYTAAFPTLWHDDHEFYTQSTALAAAWHHHFFPDITQKGDLPYMGTLHVGYQRALAALYYCTGPSTMVGLLLNVVCISVIPVFLGLATRVSCALSYKSKPFPSPDSVGKIALATALIAACYPSQFYWSAFLLKDLFLSTVFLATLFLVCVGCLRRDPTALAGFLYCDYFLYSVRAYAAISLAIGLAAWLISHLPRRYIIAALLAFAATLYLLINYTETGDKQSFRLWSSIMFLAPSPNITVGQSLSQLFGRIPRFVLAPYAWVVAGTKDPLYGLYPGMWYLYLVVYPLAGAGFFWALRKNFRIAMIPILAFWCSAFILIMAVFAGNTTRQRYYLEYLVMMFAGIGCIQPQRFVTVSIVVLEAVFAIGQLIILKGHSH